MNKWLTAPRADVLALLLGALLVLAFAPFEIFPFAILAPAGLLTLWLNQSPKRAFWLGFLFGLGLFGGGVYWVYISMHSFGDLPPLAAFGITAAMVAILAIYPAMTGYLINRYFPSPREITTILAFPAIWVALEWVRSWLFTGFPWLFLGYSQTNTPLIGYAPLFSVYGVSLAVALTSGMLVSTIFGFKEKKYKAMYLCLLVIVVIWTTGGLLNLIAWTEPQRKKVNVSLVQGNVPQTIKWSPEHISLSMNRYAELTAPLLKKDAIIIWPEAAIPLPLKSAADFINFMDRQALKNNAHIILGIPIQNPNGDGYFNAIVTLGSDKQVYLKRQLVPWGEYVPFSRYFANLFAFMNIPMSNLVEGKYVQPPVKVNGTTIFMSICYEIAYPELSKVANPVYGLLLTVTNDAWFGNSIAQAQHLQMAQMRAVELRRPLLFVTNDGITAIVGPNGRIESSIPPHQISVLTSTVQPMLGLTPWMRHGMDPILGIIIGFFAAAKLLRRKYKLTPMTPEAISHPELSIQES